MTRALRIARDTSYTGSLVCTAYAAIAGALLSGLHVQASDAWLIPAMLATAAALGLAAGLAVDAFAWATEP